MLDSFFFAVSSIFALNDNVQPSFLFRRGTHNLYCFDASASDF
jgi:hypothetical protein